MDVNFLASLEPRAPRPAAFGENDYKNYRHVLVFLLMWVAAAFVVLSLIDSPAPTSIRLGYTKSLLFVFLPLGFLIYWYVKKRDQLKLRAIMREMMWKLVFVGLLWVALDVLFANLFFRFPDENAHLDLTQIPGYLWSGGCATLWTIWKFSCYTRNIPLEEALFYLGSAAILTLMYLWASEDFYRASTMPREEYEEAAKNVPPLIQWNKRFIAWAVAVFALAFLIKKFGWWHGHHEGWPSYLLAQLIIVFVPLSAVYNRVHRFTNPPAFLFVLILTTLISLTWETTLALPYGWWNYQMTSMTGIEIVPWSRMALEAPLLWLAIGWSSMFVSETVKIKVLSGRTWPQVLCGKDSFRECIGLGRPSRRN